MYRGLDIVTNKVTQTERNLVKHHMINFLDPLLRFLSCTILNWMNNHLLLNYLNTLFGSGYIWTFHFQAYMQPCVPLNYSLWIILERPLWMNHRYKHSFLVKIITCSMFPRDKNSVLQILFRLSIWRKEIEWITMNEAKLRPIFSRSLYQMLVLSV